MARRIDAWMDGKSLRSIGGILIQGVNEPPADRQFTTSDRLYRSGLRVTEDRRTNLRITIECAIWELYDLKKRNNILQAIAEWADGSILELSNHADQRLHVIRRTEPSLGEVRDYTQQISIELQAPNIPYWEDKLPNKVTGSGSSGSTTLLIPGTAKEIPVEAKITPTGGAMTSLAVTVSCGGVTRSIALSGINIGTSSNVIFGRDDEDRLTIKSGSTSLLRYRTAASADDLILPHGNATVSWTANVAVSAEFSTRGRWL